MTTISYLVDNNVLSRMTRSQRAHMATRGDCWIPSEVLHEADGFPDILLLTEMEYPLTASVIDKLRLVMSELKPGDADLVDLYANEGNADPILIACALDARESSEDSLFPEEWVVVTNDGALRDTAVGWSVRTISSEDFVAHLAL